MRIGCPHCGERDVREFTYLGDATVQRPDPNAPDKLDQFCDYVFFRKNPAGVHKEHWYHGAGCQRWLVVTRDTKTHQIFAVAFVSSDNPACAQ
jgi:heterotetrameric sarcosine oxidase delta subunit